MVEGFEGLEVWKRSSRLCVEIYKGMRNCKDYGFRDQLTRSALSVPSNIAEGYERQSVRECVNFFSYSRGSCGELRTQIYIGLEVGYIDQLFGNKWISETKQISAMLSSFMSVKKAALLNN